MGHCGRGVCGWLVDLGRGGVSPILFVSHCTRVQVPNMFLATGAVLNQASDPALQPSSTQNDRLPTLGHLFQREDFSEKKTSLPRLATAFMRVDDLYLHTFGFKSLIVNQAEWLEAESRSCLQYFFGGASRLPVESFVA